MRKTLFCNIKSIFMLAFITSMFFVPLASATTEDFYFEDFTADYYLYEDNEFGSRLHVKETLTAVFPEIDQNHGITRTIPYLNQAGKNRTIESRGALNFTALRNGVTEPIAKITEDKAAFTVYLGSQNEYVHGVQTYTLEYDFTNVITEFDGQGENVTGKSGITKAFQELYWDTNGTGWKQKFKKVTANFHIDPTLVSNLKPETWCYVGKYGEKGQDRCKTTQSEHGFTLSTENLSAGENLSFVVHLTPETIQVPLKRKEYSLVWFTVLTAVICLTIVMFKLRKWRKCAEPFRGLRALTFISPQYLPPEDEVIQVAEAEQLYLRKTRQSYVATLLELVVKKKVTMLKKVDEKSKKNNWIIRLEVSPYTLSGSQRSVLEILNGGSELVQGSEIRVEKHRPNSSITSSADTYSSSALWNLEEHEYIIKEKAMEKFMERYRRPSLVKRFLSMCFLDFAIVAVVAIFFELWFFWLEIFEYTQHNELVGESVLPILIIVLIVFTVDYIKIINRFINKYSGYTDRGIKMNRYLGGLELYIKMAEKDRLAFLQSVEGVDVTNDGIVKIYERLLPWASLFGVEDSWLRELSRYYDVSSVVPSFDTSFVEGVTSGVITNEVVKSWESSTRRRVAPPSSGSSDSGWSSSDHGGGGSSSSSGSSSSGGSGGGGGGGGGGGW